MEVNRAAFVFVDPVYETTTALRSWGAAHRSLWKALRERGRRIDVVAVTRTWEELNRAGTVLDNWAREPRPSGFDAEVSPEIARIEEAILQGKVQILEEFCGLQGAMKRSVALTKRARMQAGPGVDPPHHHMADRSARGRAVFDEKPTRQDYDVHDTSGVDAQISPVAIHTGMVCYPLWPLAVAHGVARPSVPNGAAPTRRGGPGTGAVRVFTRPPPPPGVAPDPSVQCGKAKAGAREGRAPDLSAAYLL